MASIIKLKRSSTQSSVPGSLEEGEIAVNLFDRKLYVGNSAGVTAIGGEDFRITVDEGTTSGDGAYIKLLGDTASSTNSVFLSAGEGLDITLEANGSITFGGEDATTSNKGIASFSSDNFSVSSGAVTIKDGGVVNAELANKTIQAGKIADGTITATQISAGGLTANTYGAKSVGTAAIADAAITSAKIAAGGITANAVGNDSVALGTKTTGNYVATASGSGGVSVSGSGSETAAITISLDDNISANTSGKAATAGNADTATALETARFINLSGDVTGNVSFDGTATATIVATIAADSVALGTDTTGNYVATISGTANEIEVSGSGSETAAVTIGLPNDVTIGNDLTVTNDATIQGALTVDGNLTVEGALTYLSTSTVYTDDGMFKLSANNAGDTIDTGIYGKYVVTGNSAVQFSGYFRDATDGVFKFYTGLDVEPTATVDTSDTGYNLAQVDAIIDGGTY